MPDLSQEKIQDIEERLDKYLNKLDGYSNPKFLASGGSAAVFRVDSSQGFRAFKVFDPSLIGAEDHSPDRRRLSLQARLINHSCPFLIQTYRVDLEFGTAFIEMEYIEWPQLKNSLSEIPDEKVVPLIGQLVDAVKFLEKLEIIHRDIKPENIHVSPEFDRLILLDLGVAREFEIENGAASTDHENKRLFLATAQYSSPEYLFRLDAPSRQLWHGLNIYQVGAVLHDLIMKRPLFQDEIELANRWLVARAVLTKTPSFNDHNPGRLAQQKSLAARCLSKDINIRTATVSWDDFIFDSTENPLKRLRSAAIKSSTIAATAERDAFKAKLEFERTEFWIRVAERVRAEIQSACGPELPTKVKLPFASSADLEFKVIKNTQVCIESIVSLEWNTELYAHTATVLISSRIILLDQPNESTPTRKVVCESAINENEDVLVANISSALANSIMAGVDLVAASQNLEDLHELDIQNLQ